MIRFLSLLVFFAFFVMFVSGCSSYTIERAEIEMKKTPSHTDAKKNDDEYEHDSRDFGQSHKKEKKDKDEHHDDDKGD